MNAPVLSVSDLTAGYGPVPVLHGLSFDVATGEIISILGANGAGKTTLLRALSGLIAVAGAVTFDHKSITGWTPEKIVAAGITHVPQGRGTFAELSVHENLYAGAYTRRDRDVDADIDHWYGVFPRLGERRRQLAGSLSGGEQQMLALARGLMSRPTLLLLDEPSLGLAPMIAGELFDRLAEINQQSATTMVIVEQNAGLALSVAARAYILEAGRIVLDGSADDLKDNDAVRRAYLGY